MTKHGHFCWNELMTPDVTAAKAFYAAALGWTFVDSPMPDGVYTTAHADGEPVAGIFPWPEDKGATRYWFSYIAVDDIAATIGKLTAAGGSVLRGPWPIPGVGQIAIVCEPNGACFGLLQGEVR